MQHNITGLARNASATPRTIEQDVVAAISSAEGTATRSRAGGRAFGFALPLLALAAGAALGYSGTRWLGPSPWRRLPAEPWRRLADGARPIFGNRS